MKVLIDTNVILDVLIERVPHYERSAVFLKLCGTQVDGYIAASQTTDIFYLLTRAGKSAQSAKGIIKELTDNIKVLDIITKDVNNALSSDMPDFEDALLACRAERKKIDLIITRNEKDFTFSKIPAMSPMAYLKQSSK
jgi:predicted nucleic acid-binding protein